MNKQKKKLTPEQVREIRKKNKSVMYTYRRLGEEYGVSQSVISDIICERTYKSVGDYD